MVDDPTRSSISGFERFRDKHGCAFNTHHHKDGRQNHNEIGKSLENRCSLNRLLVFSPHASTPVQANDTTPHGSKSAAGGRITLRSCSVHTVLRASWKAPNTPVGLKVYGWRGSATHRPAVHSTNYGLMPSSPDFRPATASSTAALPSAESRSFVTYPMPFSAIPKIWTFPSRSFPEAS